MPWSKTGATLCHEQLGLPDKGRAIKELVVCFVLLNTNNINNVNNNTNTLDVWTEKERFGSPELP